MGAKNKKPPSGFKKIKIGRLKIDPVFLAIFLFFTLTGLFWFVYLLISLN